MNNESKKCTSKEHKDIDAVIYCSICNIYMCNKCENFHSILFQNHSSNKIDKDNNELFTGFCKEENHYNDKLKFYCKTHKKLCCGLCLCKIKKDGMGQHTECDVCHIEDIKDEKKNKLKDNIKCLEDSFNTFNESFNKLKIIYEKINENKENLKIIIQKFFTKVRNTLNEREDNLLLEVDQKFNELYFKEELIKEGEKLPNKIKLSLEKGKNIDKNWDDYNELSSLINDCINIENNINYINIINDSIKKCNNSNYKVKFLPDDDNEINKCLETIKKYGEISIDNYCFDCKKSTILKNSNEIIKLIGWISTNNKIKEINLLYKSSEHGDTSKIFFEKCGNKGPTFSLIETSKGRRFGGFSKTEWTDKKDTIRLKDNEAFLFSLDNMEKYKIIKTEIAIGCYPYSHILVYGNNGDSKGIYIEDKFLKKNSYENHSSKAYDVPSDYCLSGERTFSVKEIEVYQVIFE